ncbi:hypothetical protein Prudu_004925 [Prunus dulcis]|uniref:Uncharacterized protein n=1 Tax=Prunus dulcis TaxID=3755 RepID=A0A4Y1QWG1_PRUDU|nr:hypothetical protein Prudu_004925 [Prunus dulcis]
MATIPVALEPPSSPLPFQPTSTPGRPELAGKSCFPTEASEVQPISMRKLQRVVEVHRIHHRATLNLHASKSGKVKFWDWSKYRGDSAKFSAEV